MEAHLCKLLVRGGCQRRRRGGKCGGAVAGQVGPDPGLERDELAAHELVLLLRRRALLGLFIKRLELGVHFANQSDELRGRLGQQRVVLGSSRRGRGSRLPRVLHRLAQARGSLGCGLLDRRQAERGWREHGGRRRRRWRCPRVAVDERGRARPVADDGSTRRFGGGQEPACVVAQVRAGNRIRSARGVQTTTQHDAMRARQTHNHAASMWIFDNAQGYFLKINKKRSGGGGRIQRVLYVRRLTTSGVTWQAAAGAPLQPSFS